MLKNKLETYYKNLEVVITGGAGFIGSHIAQKLVALGANVTIIDNLSTGKLENIETIINKINFIKSDITNLEACIEITKNKKMIFHLAAFVSVPNSMNNPNECNKINVLGTFNLLEACRINKIEKFIFSSSSAVYGKMVTSCSEDDLTDPISIYGFSKLIGEQYCQKYNKLFNIQTLCLRYFNVYGPRQNPNGEYAGVVAKFMDCIKNNKPITIYGDGLQTRDYISVHDVAQANINLAMLSNEHLNGQPVNIATGNSITLLELINNLKQESESFCSEVKFLPARNGDIAHSQANCKKLLVYNKLLELT